MKNKLCIIILLSLFISGCNKITQNKSKDAIVRFDNQNYDFGNIKMHKIISHTF